MDKYELLERLTTLINRSNNCPSYFEEALIEDFEILIEDYEN